MKPEQIEAALSLARAATPYERWLESVRYRAEPGDDRQWRALRFSDQDHAYQADVPECKTEDQAMDDTAFACEARRLVPELAGEVLRLRKLVERTFRQCLSDSTDEGPDSLRLDYLWRYAKARKALDGPEGSDEC